MNLTISKLYHLTDTLLENFELTDQGQVLLIDFDKKKYIGIYEWCQGRCPHGFDIGGDRLQADEVEYVAFFAEE